MKIRGWRRPCYSSQRAWDTRHLLTEDDHVTCAAQRIEKETRRAKRRALRANNMAFLERMKKERFG
jgi:hypothetical protein